MAHSKLSHDLQAALDCDLCEGHVKVDWHCLTCPANLCVKCHVLHTSRKNFRKHKVIPRANLRQARREEATPKCSAHANNDATLQCVTCKVLVCVGCIPNAHNGHKFESLDAALRRSRNNLAEYIKHLEEKQKEITSVTDIYSGLLKSVLDGNDKTKKEIIAAGDAVKVLVDKEVKEKLEGVEEHSNYIKNETYIVKKNLEKDSCQVAELLASAYSLLKLQTSTKIDKFLQENPIRPVDEIHDDYFSYSKFHSNHPFSTFLIGRLEFGI